MEVYLLGGVWAWVLSTSHGIMSERRSEHEKRWAVSRAKIISLALRTIHIFTYSDLAFVGFNTTPSSVQIWPGACHKDNLPQTKT